LEKRSVKIIMKDLISVVIPVYNHAHTLNNCLKTVINSGSKSSQFQIEIIIVNDGSTDNFQEVMEKILKNDIYKSKIKKVLSQENKGAPAARNLGFKEISGDYVVFVDADTICYSSMFEQMYQTLALSPEVSYAYSQFKFGWKKMKSHVFDGELLKKINYIDVTSLIRTKDFIPFDKHIKRFQDWDLWLSMFEQGKIGCFIPKILYKKIVGGRQGISSWLPSWFYKIPWKIQKVKEYEEAKKIIFKKHGLI